MADVAHHCRFRSFLYAFSIFPFSQGAFEQSTNFIKKKIKKANGRSNRPPTSSFNNLGIDSPSFTGPSGSGSATESSAPPSGPGSVGAGVGASSRERICPHCTFVNEHGGNDCEICGLPLDD